MQLLYIPVSEAVKKFVEKDNAHFLQEIDGENAIKITKRHYLGNLLNLCINEATDPAEAYGLPMAKNHRVCLAMPGHYGKLSGQRLNVLSRHLELEFRKGLVNWIRIWEALHDKPVVSEAIRAFYEFYELQEDECCQLSLRRWYQDYKIGKTAV